MSDVTIQPLDKGPYLVQGVITVLDAEGNAFTPPGATIALCRCGGSSNKPFCDGTHSKNGFDAVDRATSGSDAG